MSRVVVHSEKSRKSLEKGKENKGGIVNLPQLTRPSRPPHLRHLPPLKHFEQPVRHFFLAAIKLIAQPSSDGLKNRFRRLANLFESRTQFGNGEAGRPPQFIEYSVGGFVVGV